jgi:hypothetical protein
VKALAADWLGVNQMDTGEAVILCGVIAGIFGAIAFLVIQCNLLVHHLL